MKRWTTDQEKTLIIQVSDKEFESGLCSKKFFFFKLRRKQSNKKVGKRFGWTVYQRRWYMMDNKHMKRFWTSLIIREMQIKPQWNITTQLLKLLKFNRLIIPDISKDAELELLLAGGHVWWYNHSRKHFGGFWKSWLYNPTFPLIVA